MSFFDTLTKQQQAYKAKREQQYKQALDCIKKSSERGIHKKGVHRKTEIREAVLNRMIDDMHEQKLIHIKDWAIERSAVVALYAIGEAEDAPRVLPTITPKAERQKERRHGGLFESPVRMNEEQQLKAAVERKHQEWAETWKPHRDFAASWI